MQKKLASLLSLINDLRTLPLTVQGCSSAACIIDKMESAIRDIDSNYFPAPKEKACELDLVEKNIGGDNHIFGDLHFASGVEVSPTLPDATFYGRSYYANGRKRGVVFYGLSPFNGFKFESERDAIVAISSINENSAPGF